MYRNESVYSKKEPVIQYVDYIDGFVCEVLVHQPQPDPMRQRAHDERLAPQRYRFMNGVLDADGHLRVTISW
jgi:hypothetical protein